ncbi:hypothetical protein IWW35_006491, partial [Coemansia sp. RSA 1878]
VGTLGATAIGSGVLLFNLNCTAAHTNMEIEGFQLANYLFLHKKMLRTFDHASICHDFQVFKE